MSDEDVLQVGGVTTGLGIEVRTTRTQTAVTNNLHPGLREFEIINRELVGVPSVLCITAVGVNRTEHARIYGASQFMLEGMTCQRSVVHLNIDLEVLIQSVGFEETDNGLGIHIILVFARLHWLGLNEESTLESLRTSIVSRHTEHSSHVLFLTLLVSVEKRHIALATAPEHIVLCAEFDTCVNSVLNLHDSTSHYIKIRVGARTVHVTGMPKDIGS